LVIRYHLVPNRGYLEKWAKQEVLLLNTILTVRAGPPNSHKEIRQEKFTAKVIEVINNKEQSVVFTFWGNNTKTKKKLITNKKHLILKSSSPNPYSSS